MSTDDADVTDHQQLERLLIDVGALTEREAGHDLRLTAPFQESWDREITAVEEKGDSRHRLLEVLGIESDDVEFETHDEAFQVFVDGRLVGLYESEPAFAADLAAAELLQERYEDWDDLSVGERSQLLKGLRLFLETCPGCGAEVTFDTETVESCCGSHQVAAVTCDNCGARLFESAPIRDE